jgi:hypothetical protein
MTVSSVNYPVLVLIAVSRIYPALQERVAAAEWHEIHYELDSAIAMSESSRSSEARWRLIESQGPGKVAIRPRLSDGLRRGRMPRDRVGPGREPDSSDRHVRTFGADRDLPGPWTHGACCNANGGHGRQHHRPGSCNGCLTDSRPVGRCSSTCQT